MKSLMLSIAVITALALGAADPGCIIEDNSTNPCYSAYSAAAADVAVAGAAVCTYGVAVDMRSRSQATSNAIVLDTSAPGMVILVF